MVKAGKRILSALLAATMTFSLVPLQALADSKEDTSWVVKAGGTNYFSADGKAATESNYDVALTKTIEKIADSDDFNVTLKASARTEKTNVKSKAAAVSLVIDTSGSMGYCSECGEDTLKTKYYCSANKKDEWKDERGGGLFGWSSDGRCDRCGKTKDQHIAVTICTNKKCPDYGKPAQSRMDAAKTAACAFLDSYVKDAKAERWVSLISFDDKAYQFDLDSSKKGDQYWIDAAKDGNLAAIKKIINGDKYHFSAGGGTYTQAGMDRAASLLNVKKNKPIKNIDNRFCVLLTDGAPTYYTDDDGYREGNGSDTTQDETYGAQQGCHAVTATGAKLYSVAYGMKGQTVPVRGQYVKVHTNTWLKDYCGSTQVYTPDKADELVKDFQLISESTTGSEASAVTDTIDTIGANGYITYIPNSASDAGNVLQSGNELKWTFSDAAKKTEGDFTTYTMTYKVRLNIEKEKFAENNEYSLGNMAFTFTDLSSAKDHTASSVKPSVAGKLPMENYTVEYYKQNVERSGYDKIEADTKTGSAKLGSTVTLAKIDPNYAGKYENYSVKNAIPSLKLTRENNVLTVYYDHNTAAVTVNHYVKTTTYQKDGTKQETGWVLNNKATDTCNVGDSFEAKPLDAKTYKLDSQKSGKLKIDKVTGNATINLYYTCEIDNRKEVQVTVKRQLYEYQWQLVNNPETGETKYVQTAQKAGEPTTETVKARAHSTYSVKADFTPKDSGKVYKLGKKPEDVTATSGSSKLETVLDSKANTVSVELGEGNNVITLNNYYGEALPNPNKQADVTVTYRFTKNVTKIVNGKIVTDTNAPKNVTKTEKHYVGETVKISAPGTYTPADDKANAYTLTGEITKTVTVGDKTNVTFDYACTKEPENASVTIVRTYFENVLTTNTDGTTATTKTQVGDPETTPVSGTFFEGQLYTADASGAAGYTLKTPAKAYANVTLAKGVNTIQLEYLKDTENDKRDSAKLHVVHNYLTNTTSIIDGREQTLQITTTETADVSGKVGDQKTISPETTDKGGNKYSTDQTAQTVTLARANADIVFNYVRDVDNRQKATYQVNYKYIDWQMTVKDGKAAYYDDAGAKKTSPTIGEPQSSYAGMDVTLQDGGKAGYEADPANVSAVQRLKNGSNVFTLTYVKKIPLAQEIIAVKHQYTTVTKAENGTSESKTVTTDEPNQTIYLGEAYTAKAAAGEYKLTGVTVNGTAVTADKDGQVKITVGEKNEIQFNYSKTIDNSKPATCKIRHFYRVLDWNDKTDKAYVEDASLESSIDSTFATLTQTGTPNLKLDESGTGYQLDKVAKTGNGTLKGYTLTLAAGDNTLDFYYTKTIDTRKAAKVTVNHVYRVLDTNAQNGYVEEGIVQEFISTVKDGAWVGNNYQAALKTTFGAHSYSFAGAAPENHTIKVVADPKAGKNEITIYYTRSYGSTDVYQVIGKTEWNGISEKQRPVTSVSLMQNDKAVYTQNVDPEKGIFTLANVVPGKYTVRQNIASVSGYTCTTKYSVQEITVGAGTDYVKNPLIITNDYTKNSSPIGPVIPVWPTNPPVVIPPESTPAADAPSSSGSSEVEIPDESTPLAGGPTSSGSVSRNSSKASTAEVTIGDDQTPKAEAPVTGDTLAGWIIAACAACTGILILVFGMKKHEGKESK